MTTPPTPAGWYPDPEDSSGLRYWDGATWTEHRSPAQAPPAPQPSYGSTEYRDHRPVRCRRIDTGAVGRARRPCAAPIAPRIRRSRPPSSRRRRCRCSSRRPSRPGNRRTSRPRQPAHEPPPERAYEPAHEPAPLPITEQPTTRVPLREPMPYADATTPTPAEPQEVEPPAGTEPLAPPDNRKLLMGFAGAVAALLVRARPCRRLRVRHPQGREDRASAAPTVSFDVDDHQGAGDDVGGDDSDASRRRRAVRRPPTAR